MFLLDTNVVSELRKAGSGRADPNVTRWAASVPTARLFISVITLMELESGVLRMARRDARQGAALRHWLTAQVTPAFAGRVLPVDEVVALRAAALHVPDPRPDSDALIAATALVHGLTVVTRNRVDFEPMAVALLDPWRPG
jgi:predicted nucleic acid-binding protein